MGSRKGKYSFISDKHIGFVGEGTVVGKTEGQGRFGSLYDYVMDDDLYGEKTWEKAESKMFYEAARRAVEKSGMDISDIDLAMGGDLLNQLIASGFAARELEIPFLGLYGACSTMSESLTVGTIAIESGLANKVICAASSHFSTAERQFRTPLELGTQKTPTAQRTATGAGASVLSLDDGSPRISALTIGRVIDKGIKDANNMGAAMAPAAFDTMLHHFRDFSSAPDDYDEIYTGDLGQLGLQLLKEMLGKEGFTGLDHIHDCGDEIYTKDQDPHMGGSGCGCSAVVLNSYLIPRLRDGIINKILFMATGALLSPTSTLQGESIPSVAHLILIER